MADYEYKTYPTGGVELNGFYTAADLRRIVEIMDAMNSINARGMAIVKLSYDEQGVSSEFVAPYRWVK